MFKLIALALLAFAGYAQADTVVVTSTFDCPSGPIAVSGTRYTCTGTPVPPIPPVDSCPVNAVRVTNLYPVIANGSTPYAKPGQIMTIRMAVPLGAPMDRNRQFQFLGTYSGSPSGYWALSETPCDFSSPLKDTINFKPDKPPKVMAGYANGAFSGTYNYGPVGSQGVTKIMEVNKTYYLNIRFDACAAVATCGFEYVKLP